MAATLCAGAVRAEDPPPPDLDLLEYLGSWQGSDEEWLAVIDWRKDQDDADSKQATPPPADGAKEKDDDADRK